MRLPREYWKDTLLASLLSRVGVFLKADEYTLTRSKGKFARVCLNVDVTKPLRARPMLLRLVQIHLRMCLRLWWRSLAQLPFRVKLSI